MTRRSRPGAVTGLPSAKTIPLSGFSNPAMILRRVDFPQPLAPTMQTNSASATFMLTRSSARTVPARLRKLFDTLSIASLLGETSASSSVTDPVLWPNLTEPRLAWKCQYCLEKTSVLSILHRLCDQLVRHHGCKLNSFPRLGGCVRREGRLRLRR